MPVLSYWFLPLSWTASYHLMRNFVECSPFYSLLGGAVLAYLTTYLDALPASKEDGQPWPAFQYASFWEGARKIHSATIELEEPLNHDQQYVFGAFPHGACTISHFLTFTDCCGMLSKHHRGPRRDLAASILFLIPVFRELISYLGCVDASAPTAHYNLKKGRSILIFVGGEKEQLFTKPQQQKIYLRNRKGFVKLALQYGAHLVPMYTFGENEMYHTSDFLRGFRGWLERNFHIGWPIFWGRWGSILPFPRPLHLEVGKPIIVEKVPKEEITDEMVNKLHDTFIAETQRLFDRTKVKYEEYASAQLEIV